MAIAGDPADVRHRDGRRSDSRGRLYEEIETVAFEDRLHCLRTQERQILVGIGLGGRRQRHWIDDWIMGVVGKYADNFHSGLYLSIGLINYAERCFTARDQTEGDANILGHSDFWLDRRPCAEPFQRDRPQLRVHRLLQLCRRQRVWQDRSPVRL